MAGNIGILKLNQFEIVKIIPITALYLENTGTEIETVAHGLGYVPAFIPYILDPVSGQYQAASNVYPHGTSGIIEQSVQFFVDSTNVIMQIVCPSAGSYYNDRFTVNAKVYLLRETATT